MSLREIYEKIGTDYPTVLERFCNDEDMLSIFVMTFPDDATFHYLVEAVSTFNYKEIENYAHALKGVAANLGFTKLQAACGDLVLCIRQGKYDTIPENFEKAKHEYESVVNEILLAKQKNN